MKRTKLDKEIDRLFAIQCLNTTTLDILEKVQKKFPETREFIDKELEKVNEDFDKHTGLYETGKVGSWIKMEFDNK